MAVAILLLIGSGWRIYDASPIFGFRFPVWATLGGDVETALARHNDPGAATAIAWHFAALWLLLIGYVLLVGSGLFTGHFRRHLLPVGPAAFLRDFRAALALRLDHAAGGYSAVPKVFYWGARLAVLGVIVSGIAISKPVQTQPLVFLFGGFQGARLVHFLLMVAIVLFLCVHLALVALVPRTLVVMVLGRPLRRKEHVR